RAKSIPPNELPSVSQCRRHGVDGLATPASVPIHPADRRHSVGPTTSSHRSTATSDMFSLGGLDERRTHLFYRMTCPAPAPPHLARQPILVFADLIQKPALMQCVEQAEIHALVVPGGATTSRSRSTSPAD